MTLTDTHKIMDFIRLGRNFSVDKLFTADDVADVEVRQTCMNTGSATGNRTRV
jgi:hypothetical protein